jgi:hypothetical protein
VTLRGGENSPSSTGNSPQRPSPEALLEGQQEAALLSIIGNVDKIKDPKERQRLFREFMNRSTPFVAAHPLRTNLWIVRTAVACEVNQSVRAWEGGLRLKALGLEGSSDPKVKALFAVLEKKGWVGGEQGPAPDLVESEQEVRQLAEAGDSWFQVVMGLIFDSQAHWKDLSTRPNDVESVQWFRQAAQAGDAYAQLALGYRFTTGRGVAKDLTEAVKWCRKAAEVSIPPAQCDLGVCYEKGIGVTKDESQALGLFREASRSGYARAMCELGVCYENGGGVAKDDQEALKWYRKAAAAGDANAQAALAHRQQ